MKIALFTEIINRRSGSRAPLEIAKALAKRGNQVTVIAYSYRLEKEAFTELVGSGVGITLFQKKNIFTPFKVFLKLKNQAYDLVSFHGTLPFFLGSKLLSIPISLTYYGTQLNAFTDKFFPKKPGFLIRFLNRIFNKIIILQEKLLINLSDSVLAISKYTQLELKDLYSKQAEFVYLGVSQFQSTAKRLNSSPRSGKLRLDRRSKLRLSGIKILSVSRLVPYKGFHKLIKIFNKLSKTYPKIVLTIVGSSPNKGYLGFLRKMSNSSVKILTELPDKDLITEYKKSHIYATFDKYSFFGMPILEAASFAIPVVAIARCASAETVIHAKTGFLAKNTSEFEYYLKKMIEDHKLRVKMGRQARQHAKNFDWNRLAKHYEKSFKKLL